MEAGSNHVMITSRPGGVHRYLPGSRPLSSNFATCQGMLLSGMHLFLFSLAQSSSTCNLSLTLKKGPVQ